MRSDRARSTAWMVATCVVGACGGSTKLIRDESVPIERRLESEDRTVAKVGVRDDAIVVEVERRLVCQRGTYDDRVVQEPVHGSGWIWGGLGTMAGGAALSSDKSGATPGALLIVGGAALAIVGVAKLAAGKKTIETKSEPTYGAAQTCATRAVAGAFVSVTVGAESVAVQSTDETGTATMRIDEATWQRAPLTVHVDLPHEQTVVVEVMRDGSTQPARTEL